MSDLHHRVPSGHAAPDADEKRIPLSRCRRAVAASMTWSARIPQVIMALLVPPMTAIFGVVALRAGAPAGGSDSPVMTISLTVDHRPLDGLASAQFLSILAGFLAEPDLLSPALSD
jgi:pyruvate/2-oxoglutarate dehydrogenase complex dihydrolipoamide acyltransferase (E2) component